MLALLCNQANRQYCLFLLNIKKQAGSKGNSYRPLDVRHFGEDAAPGPLVLEAWPTAKNYAKQTCSQPTDEQQSTCP